MFKGSRFDGERVKDLSLLRRFIPYVMPGRNESAVYFEQQLRLSGALAYLKRAAEEQGRKVSFFHVVLAAVVRILAERPMMHRFVVGRRVYQRKHIDLSFAVKKQMSDDAPLTTVKVRFEPTDGLADVPGRVDAAINVGRGADRTTSEKEMRFIGRLPRFVIRLIMWGQRVLDYFNLLPSSMIRSDPLYASAFLANLGSVGVDAPFHHLYEYGTVPIFVAIGRIEDKPVVLPDGTVGVDKVVAVRYSFDERIADGYYCARSLERFKEYVENPELLLGEPTA